MVLFGDKSLEVGDVIVFKGNGPNPIIHRIVNIKQNSQPGYTTKGDNNSAQDPSQATEVIGKAVLRIPFLGYIKIWFVDLILNPITTMFK